MKLLKIIISSFCLGGSKHYTIYIISRYFCTVKNLHLNVIFLKFHKFQFISGFDMMYLPYKMTEHILNVKVSEFPKQFRIEGITFYESELIFVVYF